MNYTHFFDQILGQIEAGQVHDGIMQLAGMLDALVRNDVQFEEVKVQLRGHLLFSLLLQEPVCAFANENADLSTLADMLADSAPPADASSTGRHLFAVTSGFVFARAIREQRQRACKNLIRAWQLGRRIALVGGNLLDQSSIRPNDVSNIECLDFRDLLSGVARRFDLILVAGIAEVFGKESLSAFLARVPDALADGGSAQFASLAPGHSGSGWLAACLNIGPARLGEAEQAPLAASHGLSLTSYRDASGSLICSDLSLPNRLHPRGEIR